MIFPTEEVKGQSESCIQMCWSSLATVGWEYQKTLLPSNWGCMNWASVRAPECLVSLEKLLKICLLALAIKATQTPLRREPQGGTASIGMTKQVQTERGAEKGEHCSLTGMAGRSPDCPGIPGQASPASWPPASRTYGDVTMTPFLLQCQRCLHRECSPLHKG